MSDDWIDLALCRAFANLPWLEPAERRSQAATCAMTAVCSGCPVFDDCQSFVSRARGHGRLLGRTRPDVGFGPSRR